MAETKLHFILKNRGQSYNTTSRATAEWGNSNFTGLSNSVAYIGTMLDELGVANKMTRVVDNNDIDREVTAYQPTHAFIEALWVVPDKFEVLMKLHPTVKWVVRLHSELPFISQEGVAMDWICRYAKYDNVIVAANGERIQADLEYLLDAPVPYLPNFYPTNKHTPWTIRPAKEGFVDIGCFGAIRPLKNQLIQAIAAMRFADEMGRTLRFHINSDRVETGGNSVLKNLQALFTYSSHQLIEHGWQDTPTFLETVQQMDIGMQMSFSETFNIVTADFVSHNVPVVVSPEINWVSGLFQANPTDTDDMVHKLKRAWYGRLVDLQRINKRGLLSSNERTRSEWKNFLSE